MKKEFYSSGKLLLSGEYAILDGAWGLALPTRLGQKLAVSPIKNEEIRWKSFDDEGKVWLEATIKFADILKPKTPFAETNNGRLQRILHALADLQPRIFEELHGWQIVTHTEFPLHWGLGSSSTLINNLAVWAEVDSYLLLEKTFGGSGYDLAVAAYQKPILYRQINGVPEVLPIPFKPEFTNRLGFVYLNQKKNSRAAIADYRRANTSGDFVQKISRLSLELAKADNFENFAHILTAHESCLSETLGWPTIQEQYFNDYPYPIKSLGAWGGDFVLAIIDASSQKYFETKGFSSFLKYEEMIKLF